MSKFLRLRLLTNRWLRYTRSRASSIRPAVAVRRRVRPLLEVLEDRITPSGGATVTDLADDGTANSLRSAITTFNHDTTDTGAYTIQLQVGTYKLSIENNLDHEVSNATGDLNINTTNTNLALVIKGTVDANGKPTTTISQANLLFDRVFEIGQPGGPAGITVTLQNLIIENGFALDDGGAGTHPEDTEARGGGILDYGGNVTLSNVVVQNNRAELGSTPGSTPHYAEGGGIYVLNGSLTIKNSVIQNNHAVGAGGTDAAHPVGQAGYGGGIEFYSQAPPTPAELNITNSTIANNTAVGGPGVSGGNGSGGGGDGGGIGITTDATSKVTATITDSTISGNDAISGQGSGIDPAGTAQGGGVYMAGGNSGAVFQLINSTIAGNRTVSVLASNLGTVGGGIYFSGGKATLINVTVANNSTLLNLASNPLGGSGGGIDNASSAVPSSTITLMNTLVALNDAAAAPDYNGTVNTSDHNLIGKADGSTGFSAASPNNDQLGSIANPLDPHVGLLQNNGGPTQTMALLPGSPAINVGDNDAQMVTGPNDQRGPGFARVVNGAIDIGTFEVQPPPPSPPGGGSSPSPAPPPTLHTPPLLAFFDALLGGVETINGNGTETVIDRFFGFPLFISLYDGAGNMMSVTLFGIDVTLLFELL